MTQVDGWLARKYNMGTVLGSILDPAADKFLMTTMVVTLTMQGMLPRSSFPFNPLFRQGARLKLWRTVPLAALILGRDVGLSISAFYFRYISLPPPVSSHASSPAFSSFRFLPTISCLLALLLIAFQFILS